MTPLLNNQTDNGQSAAAKNPGGYSDVFVWGTFDGATVKLQFALDSGDGTPQDGEWFDDPDSELSFTSKRVKPFRMERDTLYRFDVSGVGASTDVSGHVVTARNDS